MGLVLHVIDDTAQVRFWKLGEKEREELCKIVFAAFRHDKYRLLKKFKASSTLSSYLTVLARRIIIRNMNNDRGEFV